MRPWIGHLFGSMPAEFPGGFKYLGDLAVAQVLQRSLASQPSVRL